MSVTNSHNPSRRTEFIVWGALILTAIAIAAAFVIERIQNSGPTPQLLSISQIPDFTLTNQNGQVITRSNLLGHVWIGDIIFTRCAGPCPRMTQAMRQLESALPKGKPVKLITLTTDPDYDTPTILKQYAARAGADPSRWWFLTGTKSEIRKVAVEGMKLVAQQKPEAERESSVDLFIHSTILVLVDKQGIVQAAFDTQDEGWKSSLRKGVSILLKR